MFKYKQNWFVYLIGKSGVLSLIYSQLFIRAHFVHIAVKQNFLNSRFF